MRASSVIALVAVAFVAGCSRSAQVASPAVQATNKVAQTQALRVCPQGHDLRPVPMLVGLPTTDMLSTMRRGEALLAGCIGNPNQPETAYVCETCKQWKTTAMAYWQPLPKDFGVESKH